MERDLEVIRRECGVAKSPAEGAVVAQVTEYDHDQPLVDSPPQPRGQSRRPRRRVLSNPLLDTISAIEDDDDDDCLGLSERKGAHSDGDTYTGYVGSNSIDSGYKSSCPTPEMVDIAYYSTTLSATEQQKRLSVASQTSQGSTSSLPGALGYAQKPRIAMGTKMMSRQSASAPSVEPRRRHDSGFSDATLGHLAVVRDSLLKTEKPGRRATEFGSEPTSGLAAATAVSASEPGPAAESQSGRGAPPRAAAAAAARPRSASMGSMAAGSPRPGRRGGSPCLPPPSCRRAVAAAAPTAGFTSPAGRRRHHSPSPDTGRARRPPACRRPPPAAPGCRGRPWHDTAGQRTSRRTREEDIDMLMYGRRPAHDEPTVSDLVAPSRRTDVSRLQTSLTQQQGLQANLPQRQGAATELGTALETPCVGPPPAPGPTRLAATGPGHGLRSKFSHMAQCMLDIIDELQNKGRAPRPPERDSPALSDYHTYEEVIYGGGGQERVREAAPSPEPPPLPQRPPALFGAVRDVAITAATADERASRRPNAPKQRNNLYSLFSSARDRRSLSHSLEQEFCRGRADDDPEADEYGFAVRK